MTDLEKYKQRRAYTTRNDKMVNTQKEILANLLEKQNNYLSTCTHRFMLYLGDISLFDNQESVYVCLGCSRTIVLNKLNTIRDDKIIIDISSFMNQETIFNSMIYSTNEIILKAQETLDRLAEEENHAEEYSSEFIKKSVLNALIEYKEVLNQNQSDEIKLNRTKK